MGVLFEFFFLDCTLAFLGAQLHLGDQAAEVLVAGASGDEKGKAERFVIPSTARNPYARHSLLGIGILRLDWNYASRSSSLAQNDRTQGLTRDFRTDVCLKPDLLCCQMKTRRAIEAVSVEQCHGWHVELGTDRCQFLGYGCAFEEAESRAGVKLDVGHQFQVKPFTTEAQRHREKSEVIFDLS